MIDPVFSIRQTRTLVEVISPWLESKEIHSADDLKKRIKTSNHLDSNLAELIDNAYERDNRLKGRMRKYRLREEAMLAYLESPQQNYFLEEKIPILVDGLSLVDNYRNTKEGVDPYSPNHVFSDLLIEQVPQLMPRECYERFILIYMQPPTYIQEMQEPFTLKDLLKETTENEINPSIQGIGFACLLKNQQRGGSSSIYRESLFSTTPVKRTLEKSPDLLSEELSEFGYDQNRYLKRKSLETYLNRQLMAIKSSAILERIIPLMRDNMKRHKVKGIPLYMTKGSSSSLIAQEINNYANQKNPFFYIGGDLGIQQGKLSSLGICDPSAMARLYGFMLSTTDQESIGSPIKRKIKDAITYVQGDRYPFLLIEENLKDRKPNIEDLADNILASWEPEVASLALETTKSFAYLHRTGFQRIEARLAELFGSDIEVLHDFRALSKETSIWTDHHKNKNILTSNNIPDFEKIVDTGQKKADVRGSEFSSSTTPRITSKWLDNYEKGIIDIGCAIERLISTLPDDLIYSILERYGDTSQYDERTKKPIPALRGTFVHELSSRPLEGLKHYSTLEKAGIKPVSSDLYTETPFFLDLGKHTLSLHPDCYLFLQDPNPRSESLDLIILDTKTNRKLPYPEHKYLIQTFLYGYAIKQLCKDIGQHIDNIYCVLNKLAFYKGFLGSSESYNPAHSTYRKQGFPPISLFSKNHFMHQAIPQMIDKLADEKARLISEEGYFRHYKANTQCKCYESTRTVCNYLSALEGPTITGILKGGNRILI